MGLGSMAVTPSASIVLLYGLSTPFVVDGGQEQDFFRGECYVYGLRHKIADVSDHITLLNFA